MAESLDLRVGRPYPSSESSVKDESFSNSVNTEDMTEGESSTEECKSGSLGHKYKEV